MKFCACSADGMTSALGVSGVECVAGVGKMCTRSRKGRCKLCFWGSSTTSDFNSDFPRRQP